MISVAHTHTHTQKERRKPTASADRREGKRPRSTRHPTMPAWMPGRSGSFKRNWRIINKNKKLKTLGSLRKLAAWLPRTWLMVHLHATQTTMLTIIRGHSKFVKYEWSTRVLHEIFLIQSANNITPLYTSLTLSNRVLLGVVTFIHRLSKLDHPIRYATLALST